MIYNLHIFDRTGACLYWKEFRRPTRTVSPEQAETNRKNLYGLLFSLKRFSERLSPTEGKSFVSYKTGTYKLHCKETLSGLKFVVCTDLGVGDISADLIKLYSQVYVPYVVRAPLAVIGDPIESSLFESKVEAYVSSLKYY